MKITEKKLVRMIVEEIIKLKNEATTLSTSAGAKSKGYVSSDTLSKQSEVSTAQKDYESHLKGEPDRFEWTIVSPPIKGKPKPKPITQTGSEPPKGTKFTERTEWVSWNKKLDTLAKNLTKSKIELDTSTEEDYTETLPTEKPPTGVGTGKTGSGKKSGEEELDEAVIKEHSEWHMRILEGKIFKWEIPMKDKKKVEICLKKYKVPPKEYAIYGSGKTFEVEIDEKWGNKVLEKLIQKKVKVRNA